VPMSGVSAFVILINRWQRSPTRCCPFLAQLNQGAAANLALLKASLSATGA